MTADSDQIADAQGARTGPETIRLRILHHASAIRAQNLPRAGARL
jgi:hypothetical protein